jgi:hypothetical protein
MSLLAMKGADKYGNVNYDVSGYIYLFPLIVRCF